MNFVDRFARRFVFQLLKTQKRLLLSTEQKYKISLNTCKGKKTNVSKSAYECIEKA